ncbi:MAG: hypothetical protein JJT77_13250 [Crocinitomicaceae bacterium]|nr:hypothetical protein [Crocinitomicaceae bacterium]
MIKLKWFLESALVIFLLVGFLACGKGEDYKDVHIFEEEKWTDLDTATFNYLAEDTTAWYNVVLNLRTTKNFRYSNLWIYFIIETPTSGRSVVAHQIPVAFPDGSWIGKEKGNKVESQLKLSAFQFPEMGNYKFKVIQSTQEAEIPHINSIIFSLYRSEEN